jgi:hypothetical protein
MSCVLLHKNYTLYKVTKRCGVHNVQMPCAKYGATNVVPPLTEEKTLTSEHTNGLGMNVY